MSIDRAQAELIGRAQGGDGAAFAELLRPEYPSAVRLANALLHDLDEAEDAVQDAAIKAWRKLRNLREGLPLRPWFLAIVANQCRDVRRATWWLGRTNEQVPGSKAEMVDVAATVDLRRALVNLGYDQRLVLVLRFYLDMPYEEIGLTLAISPKAARSRVERAVNRLRPILRIQEAVG